MLADREALQKVNEHVDITKKYLEGDLGIKIKKFIELRKNIPNATKDAEGVIQNFEKIDNELTQKVIPEIKKLLTLQNASQISSKLLEIINNLLTVGDWEKSHYLQIAANHLHKIRDEIADVASVREKVISSADRKKIRENIPAGHIQIYVSLYQVDGRNLQAWQHLIKALMEHGVTRPAYREEQNVKEFIRSKVETERHGYLVANIKESDIYQVEIVPVDTLGHQLISLKENALNAQNIVEFVHANKKRYAVEENNLVYIGDMA